MKNYIVYLTLFGWVYIGTGVSPAPPATSHARYYASRDEAVEQAEKEFFIEPTATVEDTTAIKEACWFCGKEMDWEEQYFFTNEFDSFVHKRCAVEALSHSVVDAARQEAELMLEMNEFVLE